MERHYSATDKICFCIDQALRAIVGHVKTSHRPYPAEKEPEPPLSSTQREQSARLMRVNHAGEVCAQALYHGQALGSRRLEIKDKMKQAAREEGDHLAWCRRRLQELGNHSSLLDPVWYVGSFGIGWFAGWVGDQWSLGFLAETEDQVIKHLQKHLAKLPQEDYKSYLVLKQMQQDETQHRDDALHLGAASLPSFIKKSMSLVSKIMVKTSYFI